MPLEILFLFGLIILNGLFAMSEIALVTARRGRLQGLVDQGDVGAAAALALNEDPTRFLSTIQVGITTIGILSGIVGEAALAAPLAEWLVSLGAERSYAQLGATALVVVVVTYFAIVLGELVPKRLGQTSAEGVARRVARPIGWMATAARPFVRLLSVSTDVLLQLVGVRNTTANAVTEEEIHQLIKEGSESGVIDEQERAMVRNVFRLDDRQIASLMTPRSDIVYLDLEDPLDENLRKVLDSERSRFPVCRGQPARRHRHRQRSPVAAAEHTRGTDRHCGHRGPGRVRPGVTDRHGAAREFPLFDGPLRPRRRRIR
jgi:putative hemolysin